MKPQHSFTVGQLVTYTDGSNTWTMKVCTVGHGRGIWEGFIGTHGVDEKSGKVFTIVHRVAPEKCKPYSGLAIPPCFRGMTVARGAQLVLSRCKPEWLKYAASEARGEFRGFAALHDKCDGNMLLPYVNSPTTSTTNAEYVDYLNAVMEEVTRQILL